MEETIQEVNSESSENSVDSVTQSEGNLSMAELASSLMQKNQSEETETTEEDTESVDESTTEEVESEEQSAEEPEVLDDESEQPAQPSDVLSKFNIDLDSLSEEEAKELAKHLNASAVKRFGRLTAQKKHYLQKTKNSRHRLSKRHNLLNCLHSSKITLCTMSMTSMLSTRK